MERLTEVENGTAMVKGCGSNCKYGFEYCRKEDWENCKTIDDVIDKLAQYETLEEQGLLLRLPCKVGSTVYHIANKRILEVENVDVFFLCLCVAEGRFGKTVFLTQEEAKQKLKEMESDNNDTME